MKRHIRIFNVCLSLFCILSVNCYAKEPIKSRCVVIDAGHGGKDPGTVWGKFYEKDINLSVGKAAGAIINEKLPDVKVIYTRSTDKFITLADRTNVANGARADIFISIHTNSSPSRSANGTETYVMGVDKSKANLGVAMRENGVISLESDYTERYEGYDPNSSESLIMFSLMQYSYLEESISLAKMLQNRYKNSGRANRGVKQESFLVLWRTSMPSILTEIGYLSNENEARYLLSDKGKREIAKSIAEAAIEYLSQDKDESVKNEPKMENSPVAGKINYGVQIKSSITQIPINSMNFGRYVMHIRERASEKYYKYVVGKCDIYKEALLLQDKLKETYSDAFIVAFDGSGNQIPVSQARKLTEK